jgi:hypothetical protein
MTMDVRGFPIFAVSMLWVVLLSTSCSSGGGGSAPNAPASLAAIAVSSAGINLSWTDASDNEDGFKIERGTDGAAFTQVGTVTANTAVYSDAGLTASTTYYYRVRASNGAGDSAYSNTASATTRASAATILAAPTALSAAAASSTAINLAWTDASDNEDGFKIERGTNGTAFSQIGTATANTAAYSDTGLTASTTYYYRVRASNGTGDSLYSNTAGATTPPTISLPKTGQIVSYGTGSIDDGALQHGVAWPSPRFTVTYCDGTGPCAGQGGDCDGDASTDVVTDNLTGLMWARTPDSITRAWQAALDYVVSINSGGGLCGHSDWALPNRNELRSLINYGQAVPATWLNSQGFSNVQAAGYWTSSAVAVDNSYAWAVGMSGASRCVHAGKTNGLYAWPVRSGQ